MIKIHVSFRLAPIPMRCFDWSAASPDYEPGDPIGHGATQQDAVEDYLAAIDAPLDVEYVVEGV